VAELSESNTLELRIAFHNAVSRFQAWTADVAEPRVKLRGRFCPISEVCEAVSNLSHPLPRAILAILYKETHAGDGILAAKTDETYRGAGRRLLWLVEKRKDEIRWRKTLRKHCEPRRAERKTLYIITDRGRQALANAPH
jgi:hypothetical protein